MSEAGYDSLAVQQEVARDMAVNELIGNPETMDNFNVHTLRVIRDVQHKVETLFADGEKPFDVQSQNEKKFRNLMEGINEHLGYDLFADDNESVETNIKETTLKELEFDTGRSITSLDELDTVDPQKYTTMKAMCNAVISATENMLTDNARPLSERWNSKLDPETSSNMAAMIHDHLKTLRETSAIYAKLNTTQAEFLEQRKLEIEDEMGPQNKIRELSKDEIENLHKRYKQGSPNLPLGV